MPGYLYDARVRPLVAGVPILCPAPGAGVVGTLGWIVERTPGERFGLTCRHVIVGASRVAADVDGAPVCQPAVDDPQNVVGVARAAYVDATLDAAFFEIDASAPVDFDVGGMGPCGPPTTPTKGMSVLKLGYETGPVQGVAHAVLPDGLVFVRPTTPTASFSTIGDSGAVWFEQGTRSPIALHTGVGFRMGVRVSVAIDLHLILPTLGLS